MVPVRAPCGKLLGMVKLYVDDLRTPPTGWLVARSVEEAVAVLRKGGVTHVSLDFDLGNPRFGTGLDVLDWLERAVELGQLWLPRLQAHSGSTFGRLELEARINELSRRFA